MAKGIRLEGDKQLKAKIAKLSAALKTEVQEETEATAFELFNNAQSNIRSHTYGYSQGELLNGQKIVQERPMRFLVFNDSDHAGYLEFGTGSKVDIPAEWSDQAAEWLGKGGSWEQFYDKLSYWAKMAGLVPRDGQTFESMVRWLMININRDGTSAKPFFYPAYLKAKKEFFANIRAIIQRATK